MIASSAKSTPYWNQRGLGAADGRGGSFGVFISSIEATATTLGVRTVPIPFWDAIELVRAIDNFAAQPNSGIIKLPPATIYEESIFKLRSRPSDSTFWEKGPSSDPARTFLNAAPKVAWALFR